MNSKEITMTSIDISKEKVRKERKEKDKERKVMNPSHSSPSSSQQAALPSSSNAFGLFVTHASIWTSVKMIRSENQQKELAFSGYAFLGQGPDPVKKVDEEGMAFHSFRNQMPPTVAILDLRCARALGSRNAINAFL